MPAEKDWVLYNFISSLAACLGCYYYLSGYLLDGSVSGPLAAFLEETSYSMDVTSNKEVPWEKLGANKNVF